MTEASKAASGSLDVDWLLHSKKDHAHLVNDRAPPKDARRTRDPSPFQAPPQVVATEPTPPQSPVGVSSKIDPRIVPANISPISSSSLNGKTPPLTTDAANVPANNASATTQPQSHAPNLQRPPLANRPSHEDKKGGKKDGRRASWISSISSKFSSANPSTSRNSNLEPKAQQNAPPPQSSPKIELTNPFNKKEPLERQPDVKDQKPVIGPLTPPRRPSVLVAAGKETKLDQPGFLSSALRRLSSSTNSTMGKGAGSGAICPRRVMNIDQNRERIKLPDFDQNRLKRVAFCVDVEIAGFASQADEEPELHNRPPISSSQRHALQMNKEQTNGKKDTKTAKYKDMGEGAALRNPQAATDEKEEHDKNPIDTTAPAEAKGFKKEDSKAEDKEEAKENGGLTQDADPSSELTSEKLVPGARKKEKKKRSEEERKARKEKKRKHAEANGLVPLELTRDDSDSDSSMNNMPTGASTPRKNEGGPTTDPLRIYKRCCQLRETTVLSRVKEQISKPAATLAEAPGTVPIVDLSNSTMKPEDIVTLGDWLAVVPVRKLVMDNCNLTDEGVRVILSGLSGCKSQDQARANRKLPKRLSGKKGLEQMGVIEKLSLKGNSGISNVGWKYIALFMHMSRSLKGIDLSGIPFPKTGDLSRTSSAASTTSNGLTEPPKDLASLIVLALSERIGDKLEELILSGCRLSATNVRDIVDCAIKCQIRRLGLAENDLSDEAVSHVVRYVQSNACEGLDLGGNDLSGIGHLVAEAVNTDSPLFALSLSDCNLAPSDLSAILTPFTHLKNLKFIDLSRNKRLFSGKQTAVPVLRKLLPKMEPLKRIHLSDVGMSPDQVIAISEILPDCPSMAHISILENEPLIYAMNSSEGSAQEEACAFFASLMTAVRVSETIIAIEIEVPSVESSEVVKALASQVVAYSLRNMERTTLDEVGVQPSSVSSQAAPDVLLSIVGHVDGSSTHSIGNEPAPDEDYMIASTGIVKALSVCLGSKDGSSQNHSRNITPTASGTATPRRESGGLLRQRVSKPRDVSLELCESARKIRLRLRPVLVNEDRAGNDANYRRLILLDQTLQRLIQRFEDEYPETKQSAPTVDGVPSPDPSMDQNQLSASVDSDGIMRMTSTEEYFPPEDKQDSFALKLSRTPSNTSLVARAFTDEEGRIHRFGQSMRREILNPTGPDESDDEAQPTNLDSLRRRLEELKGEEIRQRVEKFGVDNVVRELGISAKELLMLRDEDPDGFKAFRDSQLAAQMNAGLIDEEGRPRQS